MTSLNFICFLRKMIRNQRFLLSLLGNQSNTADDCDCCNSTCNRNHAAGLRRAGRTSCLLSGLLSCLCSTSCLCGGSCTCCGSCCCGSCSGGSCCSRSSGSSCCGRLSSCGGSCGGCCRHTVVLWWCRLSTALENEIGEDFICLCE